MLDRRDWVDSNLASMRTMLDPLMQRFGARVARSPIAPVSRHVAAGELGVLLGYCRSACSASTTCSSPTIPTATRSTTSARNILGLEKRFAFRPRDFRLWIAIHEVTHRAQFTGVPWMRELLPRARAPGASNSSTPTRAR